jgi:hypothetical protein
MEAYAQEKEAFYAEHPELLAAETADAIETEASEEAARSAKKAKKVKRDPSEPKKPPSPFSIFTATKRDEVKASNEGATTKEANAILKQLWKELGDEDKAEIEAQHAAAMEEYEQSLKAFEATKANDEDGEVNECSPLPPLQPPLPRCAAACCTYRPHHSLL